MTDNLLTVPTGLYLTLDVLLKQLLEFKGCPEKTPGEIQQARDAIQSSPAVMEELKTSIYDNMLWPEGEKRIKILLALGAPIDELKYGESSALAKAVSSRKSSIVKFLLKSGANPNVGVTKPINEAVYRGADMVQLLLDAGAKITDKTLRLAACSDHKEAVEICRLLLAAGAKVDQCEPDSGTPLMRACRHGSAEVASFLIDQGADINACEPTPDSDGSGMNTVLHHAAYDKSAKGLDVLLKAGVKTDVRNSSGESPRDIAVNIANKKFVKAWDSAVKN